MQGFDKRNQSGSVAGLERADSVEAYYPVVPYLETLYNLLHLELLLDP